MPDHLETSDQLINDLKTGMTYDDFETQYDISSSQARRVLDELREDGYSIDFKEVNQHGKRQFYIPDDVDKAYRFGDGDGEYRFALISDTHLGSQATHEEDLEDFYDRVEEQGIDTVFHCGDISDGWEVHQGQLNSIEPEAAGWGRLKDYVVDKYPEREGVNTFFIEGNHDHKLHRREGLRLGEMIDSERDDLHYLGDSMATIVFDEENDIDLELIHPSGGQPYCYSGDTKVLTKRHGFIRFDELKQLVGIAGAIEVATFNTDTGEMEFQQPTDYIETETDSMIHFKGQSIDAKVTPNHRMLVRKNEDHHGTEGEWGLKRASNIRESYVRQKWDVPRSAEWSGEKGSSMVKLPAEHINGNAIEADLDDYLTFLGWYISEGHTHSPGRIQVTQTGEHREAVAAAMEKVGLKTHSDEEKIKSTNKVLAEKLEEEVGAGAKNKKIPVWVKELPAENLENLLQSLFKGDGSFENSKFRSYTTASRRLAHDVIECLVKTGRAASVRKRTREWRLNGYEGESTTYEVSVGESKKATAPSLCKEPVVVDEPQTAYCVTVPNNTLFVMRNGKTMFSGNSVGYRLQTLFRERPTDQRPTLAGVGHLHGSMFAETEGVKGFYAGAWKDLTTYGKRKGHAASIGGWMIDMEVEDGEVRSLTPQWVGYSPDEEQADLKMGDINEFLDGEEA